MSNDSLSTFVLGIDLGTSGIRGVIVEKQHNSLNEKIHLSESISLQSITPLTQILPPFDSNTTQSPDIWIALLEALLQKLAQSFNLSQLTHIISDATSSTVLLCSQDGTPLTPALMYNNQQALLEAKQIQQAKGFDKHSAAQGASSTLAKVLFLIKQTFPPKKPIICHQVDFINHYLCGSLNVTDENNALKLGYDAVTQTWPNWICQLLSPVQLPSVVPPGTALGLITQSHVKQYGFSPKLTLYAGTTDSIAGFLASGATHTGDTVISLGSTLAIKTICSRPVFNPQYGIYSHKLKNNWLVGGASNAGGASLLKAYSLSEIQYLIHSLNINALTEHDLKVTDAYYPLTSMGERFPISDALFAAKMPPKPKQPLMPYQSTTEALNALKTHQTYFLNIIKGLVHIEDLAYKRIEQISQQPITRLYSVGGGDKNALWQHCRKTHFATQFNLKPAYSLDAAYGVTKLITN